ncbi:MAG: hypothetical protein M3P49_11960 [Actinomycetota bacterium]|nr:hypothetical protein [Actinomycetota bacterium]
MGAILPSMEELFSKKRPEYPWQLELSPWAPHAKLTEAERRADKARHMFEREKEWRDEGMSRHPELFYDEEAGFFSEWGM